MGREIGGGNKEEFLPNVLFSKYPQQFDLDQEPGVPSTFPTSLAGTQPFEPVYSVSNGAYLQVSDS